MQILVILRLCNCIGGDQNTVFCQNILSTHANYRVIPRVLLYFNETFLLSFKDRPLQDSQVHRVHEGVSQNDVG